VPHLQAGEFQRPQADRDRVREHRQGAHPVPPVPLPGQESTWAAEASQAAADQGKFWPFEAAVFAAQKAENSGALSKDNLKKIAQSVGIDMMMFNKSVDEGTHKDSVQAEKKIGEGMGVSSTPTFFVDGKLVKDWRDYATFKSMIESALSAAPKN
jgi:protein-disulfide isomerase